MLPSKYTNPEVQNVFHGLKSPRTPMPTDREKRHVEFCSINLGIASNSGMKIDLVTLDEIFKFPMCDIARNGCAVLTYLFSEIAPSEKAALCNPRLRSCPWPVSFSSSPAERRMGGGGLREWAIKTRRKVVWQCHHYLSLDQLRECGSECSRRAEQNKHTTRAYPINTPWGGHTQCSMNEGGRKRRGDGEMGPMKVLMDRKVPKVDGVKLEMACLSIRRHRG